MDDGTGKSISRRTFVGAAAMTMAAGRAFGAGAPGGKLSIALIGVGGQGGASVKDEAVRKENIVAMCDVDLARAGGRRARTSTTPAR